MSTPKKANTSDILRRVEETLKTAEFGLDDLINGPPERKLAGLRNLVVFGRAVTNVLQKLRSVEPEFDSWYEKYREEMKNDPLMKYFYDLRSKILKEGLLETSTQVYIRNFRVPDDLARFEPRPPNAVGFFIGDHLGGSGWEIQFPDGSVEKNYVELPIDIGSVSLHFPDPPKYHLGKELEDTSISNLARLYIDYLRKLVADAKERFGSQ